MLNKKTMRDIPGHVFPRRLDKPLPVIDSAQGMWVVDTEGRRYLDASGGAVVLNVGHGREEIAQAVYDQIVQFIIEENDMDVVVDAIDQAMADVLG